MPYHADHAALCQFGIFMIVVLEGDLAQTNTFSPLNDRVLDLVEFFLRERGGRTHLFSA